MNFVIIICLITYIFVLIFAWALCKSAKIGDEVWERELWKQMNHETEEEETKTTKGNEE
jgi:hypothetical protein